MSIRIDNVGTEAFYTQWSGNPANIMSDLCDFCADLWRTFVRDGMNYDADFHQRSRSEVEIPNSTFYSDLIETRLRSQRNWLDRNWNGFQQSDAVLVIDYCDDSQWGESNDGSAGTFNKVAAVNMRPEDNGLFTGAYKNLGSKAAAQHELCHVFDADHPGDVSTRSPQEASIMYHPHHGIGCNDKVDPSPTTVGGWHSTCTQDTIRDYISNNLP